MSVYTELVAAGVEVYNHESDLYFPVTPFTKSIVGAHPELKFTVFPDRVSGGHSFELPFGYEPFWEKRGLS